MQFSKSFGYALRGVLFVAFKSNEKPVIPVEQIAEALAISQYFLAKIMKKVVKAGILSSMRGPNGGLSLTNTTLDIPVLRIFELTDGLEQFDSCIFQLRSCNNLNPCPLHNQMIKFRTDLIEQLSSTTIGDLLKIESKDLVGSLTAGM